MAIIIARYGNQLHDDFKSSSVVVSVLSEKGAGRRHGRRHCFVMAREWSEMWASAGKNDSIRGT